MNILRLLCVYWLVFAPAQLLFCSSERQVDPVLIWGQRDKHFTTTFYPHVKDDSANFIFSPISLQLGLAMTAELAKDATRAEIIDKAILPEEQEVRRTGAKLILENVDLSITEEAEQAQFTLANSVWISTKKPHPHSLKAILDQYFRTEFYPADFTFPEKMRTEINAWVANKTQRQIRELMPSGSIKSDTQMVLVNTLYLRAPWATPFSPELTYEAPFYGINSTDFVSYMHQTGNFGLLEEANLTVVELPFKPMGPNQNEISLFLVIPKDGSSLEDLEEKLTTRRLDHWITSTERTRVDLSFPKFKVASSIHAKEILQKMGMQLPFSEEAEFDLGNPEERLIITDIVHQAVFEVDELGGIGAAGTGVVIGRTCWEPPVEVHINRPFLFFVADKASGLLLFAGRIAT